ncbi:MAG: LacI family DNA-binding transcriptional regulator [Anaerolineaceae bacterium]|nr:LacI family DNA-binding transcriptional regulator [Anaerolineaceae bacterium]
MSNKRVTSHDVARLAGVSRTTVSYVLNGKDQTISEETRSKVLEAARQLGYQPDESARTLRRGVSNEIGLFGIWPFQAQFNYEFASTLQDEVNRIGYNLVIYTSKHNSEADINNWITQILARRPLGIISTVQEIKAENYTMMQKMGVKACVLMSFEPSGYAPTAILPVQRAAYLVGAHLIQKEHRHIALLVPQQPWQEPAVQRRIKGLRQAAHDAHIGDAFRITQVPIQGELEDTRQKIRELMGIEYHPSAIYAFNDEYAFQVTKALLEMDLRIPEDITVIGTDNTSLCEVMHPSLTSVEFDMMGLANRCVKALQYQIDQQPIPAGLLDGLEPVLIPRQSG